MAKKTKTKEKAAPAKKARHSNPYKEGSRKAEIYDTFMEAGGGGDAGLKAAFKEASAKGKKLIKEGTVKSWAASWLRGEHTSKPKDPNAPKAEKKKTAAPKDEGFHPEFKYTTRERADARHESLCTSSGLRPHAFHVIEDEGRFAVVPAHYKPPGPPPQFKAGDVVYDAFIANSKAKVIESGPEQTLIRYFKERKSGLKEECVINRFLVKLPEREDKKVKRERL